MFHLHNGIRGVKCSSHTNELVTKAKKKTRRFSWTWRWMFLIQSLYPLNWLLVCFLSVSFSLLLYLRWVFTAKRKRLFIPHLYTSFTICSRTEDTAGAFKTPQICPFNSLQFRYVCHDLSLWKQPAKITIARWKCATFQIIIYQAEEKNLIRTSRILAWGKSRVGLPPYFITVRTR